MTESDTLAYLLGRDMGEDISRDELLDKLHNSVSALDDPLLKQLVMEARRIEFLNDVLP